MSPPPPPSSSSSSVRLDDPCTPPDVWIVTQPWLEEKMLLGEGPHYEAATHSVRWVDVLGKKIWWAQLESAAGKEGKAGRAGVRSVRSVDVRDAVGVTADIHGDEERILAAGKYGFALVDKKTGEMRYLARVYDGEGEEKAERMRFNDGAVDSRGRFWAGTMTDPSRFALKREGTLFRLDALRAAAAAAADLNEETVRVSRHLEGLRIPNGIGWSPVKKGVLYHTDSPTRTIWEYDYDEDMGIISNKRPWFVLQGSMEIAARPGQDSTCREGEVFTFDKGMAPDGCQFDASGDLWTAVWGAGMVLRIEDRGQTRAVTGVVRVPARLSSCCRFVPGGGMVITSASEEEEEEEPERFGGGGGGDGAGRLFFVHVGVEGAETYKFGRDGVGSGRGESRM